MINRVFNFTSNSVTGAAIIISAASLLNKFIGIARDRTLAHAFGAGPIMDAYYAAFKIPDLIYNLLVVGALTAGFIPIFTKLFQKDGNKQPAWNLANNVLNIIGTSLILLSLIGIIFAIPLSKVIALGMPTENQNLVAMFIRVMFISPVLLGISMVVGGILQSLRKFVLYSLAPIFYNLGIIIGVWFLVPTVGLIGLPIGVALGAFMHCALQIYGAYNAGWRWHWRFNLKDRDTLTIGKLMIPRTIGLAISNLNNIITTILASILPIGAIATYNYADNLQWVPIGIIGIPFALAVFPVLSEKASANDNAGFVNNLMNTVRQILFLIIPLSVIFMLLRAQIVRVILGSGNFDWTATINTADALAFFSLGLFAQALVPVLTRAFYALENTKTPFIIGMISVLVNISASLLLMNKLGISGLALAASIGAIINMILLFITLRNKTKGLDELRLLNSLWKISLAGLIMAVVVQALKYPLADWFNLDYFWGIFGQGAVAGTTGLIVYFLVCWGLKSEEFLALKNSFKKRWLKTENVPVEIETETRN
ncbi:MAG: murein biosynthesis integral membrane protein MurJ [Candidatus Magasanikbacteria bacterium]